LQAFILSPDYSGVHPLFYWPFVCHLLHKKFYKLDTMDISMFMMLVSPKEMNCVQMEMT